MVADEEFKELKERVEKLEEKVNEILQKLQGTKIEIKRTSVKGIEINVGELSFIKKLKTVLDKCLALLNYVFEKYPQHPGLAPDEIEKIFKEKFGLPIPLSTISSKLYTVSGKYVTRDRVIEKVVKYRYQILSEGQEYIKKKITELLNK